MAVKELLLQALPQKYADQVRYLQFDGRIDANAHILTDAKNEPSFKILLDTRNSKIDPEESKYLIDELSGHLQVEPTMIQLIGFQGSHGESKFSLDAKIDLPQDENQDPEVNLSLDATAAQLNRELYNLVLSLREQWLSGESGELSELDELWDAYQPQGVFDGHWKVNTLAKDEDLYSLTVSPKNAALNWDSKRLEIEDGSGFIQLKPDHVGWENLAGRINDVSFDLTGQAFLDDQKINVGGKISAAQFSDHVKQLLPDQISSALTSTKLQGQWALEIKEFEIDLLEGSEYELEYEGNLILKNASGDLGVVLDHADVDITFRGESKPGQAYP